MKQKYHCVEIAPDLYEIDEGVEVSIYLVIGETKALLIDTGIGIGALKDFVLSLIGEKKLDVLLTHNHRDHIGNAPLFDSLYMSSIDYQIGKIIRPWSSLESRKFYAHKYIERNKLKEIDFTDEDFNNFDLFPEPKVNLIGDGFVFDLGNRVVTCVLCPSHTPGSIIAIDSLSKILICGDICNNMFGLGVSPIEPLKHVSVKTALTSLQRISNLDFDKDKIFNGHSDYRDVGQSIPYSVFEKIIKGLEKIIDNDYTLRLEWVPNLNMTVESAIFDDIEIQFHSNNIF